MHRLLLISCSERKNAAAGLLPAIDRYDGPAFRVLRKYLREHAERGPSVLILSAKYGLISTDQKIPVYHCRLSPTAARELRPRILEAVGTTLRAKQWRSTLPAWA